MDVCGAPMVARVIERVKLCQFIDDIILAIPIKDKSLFYSIRIKGISHFAGSEEDVLDRYYGAATLFGIENIVRITSDCPLIDPGVVDKVVKAYQDGNVDYASNTIVRTYPDGLDVEAFSYNALSQAWKEATSEFDREHVTPYILRNESKFKCLSVEHTSNLSSLHWTVDIEEDLEFVRKVYARLGNQFTWMDILKVLEVSG